MVCTQECVAKYLIISSLGDEGKPWLLGSVDSHDANTTMIADHKLSDNLTVSSHEPTWADSSTVLLMLFLRRKEITLINVN